MKYYQKYDPINLGTRHVFNLFYDMLKQMKLHTSVVACCGEHCERYVYYVAPLVYSKVRGKRKVTAFFVEKERDRYKRIKECINTVFRGMDCIKVIHGDVFTYENDPQYNLKSPARIEDLGLGIGIKELIYTIAMPRLYKQSRGSSRAFKVQILDSSIRQMSPDAVLDMLNKYVGVLKYKIHSVNGIKTSDKDFKYALSNKRSKMIYPYLDRATRSKSTVQQHKIELVKTSKKAVTRHPKLVAYTCKNGSTMLQTMLIYK